MQSKSEMRRIAIQTEGKTMPIKKKTNQPTKGDAVLEGLIVTEHPIRIKVGYPFPPEIRYPIKGEKVLVFRLEKILDVPVYHTMSGIMSRMFPKARYQFIGIE